MNSEIRVPEGMRERSRNAKHSEGAAYGVGFEDGMLFACHDLSEHPIVPTDDQCSDLCLPPFQLIDFGELRGFLERWQRRMFREEGVPEELTIDGKIRTILGKIENLQNRIAELESRTLPLRTVGVQ